MVFNILISTVTIQISKMYRLADFHHELNHLRIGTNSSRIRQFLGYFKND